MSSVIRIAAVILRNPAGEVLSVRKSGTRSFMMPGGKLEPGEDPRGAAVREIAEELHLDLIGERLDHLGRFVAPAANESGYTVDCDVFIWPAPLETMPAVFEEIAEARWFAADSNDEQLAPLSREAVFPRLLHTSEARLT
ncbi:NUDIX hydrolase [Corynebacterium pacaense]|uniref:NUDIX hydrolase n=1 Tax=Corynebacterium pacaense TaxID=1816684 RepID=UPI0009BB6B76|nr:NUDIX domain-containing protein [Corynebacterium pacaense]